MAEPAARRYKAHMLATEGGPSTAYLNEFEEMALSVMGVEAVDGVNDIMVLGFGVRSTYIDIYYITLFK